MGDAASLRLAGVTPQEPMHLLIVGVSHRTAPVELRERIDFAARGAGAALRGIVELPGHSEAAILSTCNRAELYVGCQDVGVSRRQLSSFLHEFHGIPADSLEPHLYQHADAEAVRHLFRVACGLDSLVVGEPQVLGQVKDAYGAATEARTAGPLLNKLFHWSFAAGKRVRTETGIGEGAVSVSYAAVSLARKIFGDLKGRSVLVIGAGEMAKLTALHLKSQGVDRVTITSRTLAHATALAHTIGATTIPWERLQAAIGEADILVTATGATRPVLDRSHIEPAMRPRRNRPLFIIDIGVPRDVDPSAGALDEVFLYNIDDLQAVVRDNLSKRAAEISRAEVLVAREVEGFMAWHRSRGVVPTVVALRQRFDEIRRSELARLEHKLGGLPPETRSRVEDITRLIVEKLLLSPTEQLKAVPDAETVILYSDTLNRLFALEPNGAKHRGTGQPLAGSEKDRANETDAAATPGAASKSDDKVIT
jgi:glutamyl-tRNA reductase